MAEITSLNSKKEKRFVTFTDLFKMKQSALEKLILEHGAIYLIGKTVGVLKITQADIS